MITQLLDVEIGLADARAERGDQRLDLAVREHLVEARLLDVENLALEREDRLRAAVAALLRAPPAESPSTIYNSQIAGSFSEQSASLPGRFIELSAPLRTISRALRAASRARAASTALPTICLA